MLTSLSLIFIIGLFLYTIFTKMKLPGLIGLIITGILLSPNLLNLIDDSIMNISATLRQIALIIILTRAGLTLDLSDLKKVGRPAVLMCFVPACFEIVGVTLIAPKLLPISTLDAAIIGSIIAAVSPAVVVPRMINLIERGYGKKNSIPQLVLAGASVDDIFVIVVFTAFCSLASTGEMNYLSFINVPISIITGIIVGWIVGIFLEKFLSSVKLDIIYKLLIAIAITFAMMTLQDYIEAFIPFSGLLAIMAIGLSIKKANPTLAKELSSKYNRLWNVAEILLFTLVGAAVDLKAAIACGVAAALVILVGLVFRMVGVYGCVTGTQLNKQERLFCMLAYTPKATVQAAIGTVPLAMGLAVGQTALTVAVLSILITAPFGAICIDNTYKKLLDGPDN